MLLKGKWVLSAVAVLLVINLFFHFAYLLSESRNAAAIQELQQTLSENRRSFQTETARFNAELEAAQKKSQRLENEMERLRDSLSHGPVRRKN